MSGHSKWHSIKHRKAAQDAKRGKIEQAWGAKVRDSFGMTEAGLMGVESSAGDGFHIWTDLFHVEVVDEATGLAVAQGEPGLLGLYCRLAAELPETRDPAGQFARKPMLAFGNEMLPTFVQDETVARDAAGKLPAAGGWRRQDSDRRSDARQQADVPQSPAGFPAGEGQHDLAECRRRLGLPEKDLQAAAARAVDVDGRGPAPHDGFGSR